MNCHLSTRLTELMHRFKWTMRIIAFILMFALIITKLVCSPPRICARQRQLTLGADDETQTAPGRRLRRSNQFTAVQVASLLDILLIRLRGLPRSLYRSVPGITLLPLSDFDLHPPDSADLHRRKRALSGHPAPPFFLPRRYRQRRLSHRPPIQRHPRRPRRCVLPSPSGSRFISSHQFIPTAPAPGPLNVMTPAVFFAGLMTLLWPHAHGPSTLIPLALCYGAASGAFTGLMSAPLIALGDSRDVGRRIGMFRTILSLGALAGPPISGAIVSATGGYDAVGNYAGMFPPLPPSFFNLFLCPVRG